MSYGSVGTGLGPPVGGAVSAYGSDSSFPTSSPTGGGSLFDFGSTLDSNLLLSGLGHIFQGTGELLQSAALGGDFNTNNTGTTNTVTGSATDDLSRYGYQPLGGGQQGGTANGTGGGLDGLLQGMGGNGGLDSILSELNNLVNQLQGQLQQAPQQAPAPDPQPQFQPQPQPDPIGNLVNRANVDPQLQPAVTQIAQDPVGNLLLQGAVNNGLAGIQVRDLPDGFFGQLLPQTKEVQIDQDTIRGPDLVRTVAHELVHAATTPDGNSLREENLADQIGTDIQRRVTGFGPGYTLGGESYNGLTQDNGIINSLLQLGITFQG